MLILGVKSIYSLITPRRFMQLGIAALLAVFLFTIGVQEASAAPHRGYESLQVISTGGGTLKMKPLEKKTFSIGFKNLGPKEWRQSGDEFVSIYTYEPKYRESDFQDPSWYRYNQPATLKETRVPVGGVGHIEFTLAAPRTPGTYREVFRLAAEDKAWIPGGEFVVNIIVADDPASVSNPAPTTSAPVSDAGEGLGAFVLLRSQKKVVARGGETISYKIGVKNTGTKPWGRRAVRLPEVGIASASSDGYHGSWESGTHVVSSASGIVNPGALEFMEFKFTAPTQSGSYTLRYALEVDGVTIPDFTVDIPVEVTSNAGSSFRAPKRPNASVPSVAPQTFKYEEPMVRVGILIVDEETDWEVEIASSETSWKLKDTRGALLAEIPQHERVTAFYKNHRYYFNRGRGIEQSTFPLRFEPDKPNAVMIVTNWDRRNRGSDHPYNEYRNNFELHYNDHKDRTWLINELPMEYYLKGLGETSNISHLEYQKALITAARTYAYYHFDRNTKRVKEFFHVTGYADDQVYRGYGQEKISPRIAASAEATRGQIVTFDDDYALTPYFSRSDGRTRDWSEVWGGDVEWLQSVPAPCDKRKGRVLWGHGVGMSATEALCMAVEDAKKWDEILKYFYTGVEIERYWK